MGASGTLRPGSAGDVQRRPSPVGVGCAGHWKWRLPSFSRGCWKSFPSDPLEVTEAGANRHFQMSTAISMDIDIDATVGGLKRLLVCRAELQLSACALRSASPEALAGSTGIAFYGLTGLNGPHPWGFAAPVMERSTNVGFDQSGAARTGLADRSPSTQRAAGRQAAVVAASSRRLTAKRAARLPAGKRLLSRTPSSAPTQRAIQCNPSPPWRPGPRSVRRYLLIAPTASSTIFPYSVNVFALVSAALCSSAVITRSAATTSETFGTCG